MLDREYPPPPALQPFVKLFWVFRAEAVVLPPQRIVTDGIVEVVFNFAEPFLNHHQDGTTSLQPMRFAVAQMNGPLRFSIQGKVDLLTIRFQPWGAHFFTRTRAGDLGDELVDPTAIWGPEARMLHEQMAQASNPQTRLALVSAFLLDRLRDCRDLERAGNIIRQVCVDHGRISMADFCQMSGMGRRTVERTLSRTMGIPYKKFSRIQRFLLACRMIRYSRFESLAEVAYLCGYYDQAHFNHDFLYFSGQTPQAFALDEATNFFEIES